MKKKINLLLLLVFLQSCSNLIAVEFNFDFLIIKKDTLKISYPSLLPDQYLKFIDDYFTSKPQHNSRSYWKLDDTKLYLVNIVDDENSSNVADLKKIFGNAFKDERVFADFVTGKLFIMQGKMTYFYGDYSTYAKELVIVFDKGVFVSKDLYDNSKSYKSVFTQGKMDSLNFFIYSRINWDSLPEINNDKKHVMVRLLTGAERDSFELYILRGIDSTFDKEALRVLRSIPEWDVLYIHGDPVKMYWVIPVVFSNDMRLQYDRRLRSK